MLADYHLHLENGPLSMAYLEEFLQVAQRGGLKEIGISEHAFRFTDANHLWPPRWGYQGTEPLQDYIDLIMAAKARGYPVKLGIEMDYVEDREAEIAAFLAPYPWDYIIGSVHHIGDWGFDHPDFREQWETAAVSATYNEYFRLFCQGANSGLFDIMAHPDVIKVFNYRPPGTIDHLWEAAATAMATGGATLEVSTAGLRKPVGELYPAPGFLAACHRRQIPLVISSDAHYPHQVGENFAAAVTLVTEVGYREFSLFSHRRPRPQAIPRNDK